jgi:hypothetical protein
MKKPTMPPSDHVQPLPPSNWPDAHRDDPGPYSPRPIDERGEGEARSLVFAAIVVAVHATLLGASVFGTMIVGVRCERAFRDFNMRLDNFTQFAINVSHWLNNYWYAVALFVVPCLLMDGGIFYLLHRSRSYRRWSYIWAAAVLLVILLFAGCMGTVLYPPYRKIMDDLSR